MKYAAIIAAAVLLFSIGAHAQQAAPCTTLDIPTPPGTKLTTELNLSDGDILGMIKQAIPAFSQGASGASGEVGMVLSNIDLNSLSDAIRDVKQVRAMQFKMLQKCDPAATISFFEAKLPSDQGWSRLIYDSTMIPGGAMAVYSRSGQDFFAVAVDPARNSIYAVRTLGFVDVPKLATWAGKAAKFYSEMSAKTTKKPAASAK